MELVMDATDHADEPTLSADVEFQDETKSGLRR